MKNYNDPSNLSFTSGLKGKNKNRWKKNICEQCGYHLKISNSDRIDLLIDLETWDPMDEDMVPMDWISFSCKKVFFFFITLGQDFPLKVPLGT